ncbi:MAG: tRNA pseudouridine(38-40) synthase TruA [Defluviicoccus sp.]
MPRYKLTLEYDGSAFVGWQRQDNGPSVQAAVEAAISRFAGHSVTVVGAGRTDAGVHAAGQVAHVDLDRPWLVATIRAATNFHLKPAAVAVLAVEEVAATFHARFSARAREYRYRILNRTAPPVLDRGRVWWLSKPLDTDAMSDAAGLLVGRHDFSAFRAVLCQARSPLKTLDALAVRRVGEEIWLDARARSFLHNQVRIIAGTLREIGEGRAAPDRIAAALASGRRDLAGPTAPAAGLCLMTVLYPRPDGGAASVQPAGDRADDQAHDDIEDDDAGRHEA